MIPLKVRAGPAGSLPPPSDGPFHGVVIVTVTVSLAMRVSMSMSMPVLVMVVMLMMVVMVVAAAAGIAVIVPVMVAGIPLGLEGAPDRPHEAAQAPQHFSDGRIRLGPDGLRADLDRGVAGAEVPEGAHQTQRVLGADLEQILLRRADQDKATILELDGIAVPELRGLADVDQDLGAARRPERAVAIAARVVIEGQGLDDAVGSDRCLADD